MSDHLQSMWALLMAVVVMLRAAYALCIMKTGILLADTLLRQTDLLQPSCRP